MGSLLNSLGNPDTSSSLVPLLIVGSLLGAAILSAFAFSLVKIWRAAHKVRERFAKENATGGAPAEKPGAPALVAAILHDVITPEPKKRSELQKTVEHLKGESHELRDLYGKAIGRIAELEGTVKTLQSRNQDDKKLLEIETQRRTRGEATVKALESQIKDIIHEVEKIYSQNAKVAEAEDIGERIAQILREAGDGRKLQDRIDAQDVEIRQLKQVLSQAKQQIVELAKPK